MTEEGLTASAVMHLAEQIEEKSAAFYQQLASRFEKGREEFLGFVEESEKNRAFLVRTYQETVSDALETAFSCKGLDLAALEISLPESATLKEAMEMAMSLERRVSDLYFQISEQSQSLLATIPRAFARVARKRAARIEVLQNMIGKT